MSSRAVAWETGTARESVPRQKPKPVAIEHASEPKARQGESIRVGDAHGPNQAGNSLETIKKEITSSFSEDPDRLVQQTLPRRERDRPRSTLNSCARADRALPRQSRTTLNDH